MTPRARRLLLRLVARVVGSTCLVVAPARADLRPLSEGRERLGEAGYRDVFAPARRGGRRLFRDGVALFLDARVAPVDDGISPPPRLQLERALDRFDRARVTLPDDVELAVYRGLALADLAREEGADRAARRTDDAIAELERARSLEPGFEASSVALALASLRARAGDYDGARAEYERARLGLRAPAVPALVSTAREEALYFVFASPSQALLALNEAEAVMLGGDPVAARALYAEAIRASRADSLTLALALFGRALAEERSGLYAVALATAEEATRTFLAPPTDPRTAALVERHGALAPLHMPGVSFDPPFEIHAYEALAHEALALAALREHREEEAAIERERAVESLRAFFALGGAGSRYASVAEQALERLEASEARRPSSAQLSIGPSASPL